MTFFFSTGVFFFPFGDRLKSDELVDGKAKVNVERSANHRDQTIAITTTVQRVGADMGIPKGKLSLSMTL